METTVIDFSPVLSDVLTVLMGLISLGALWLGKRVDKWLTEKTKTEVTFAEDLIRKYLNDALSKSLDLALSKLEATGDWTKIQTKSLVLAEAANYVIKTVPDALSHFGITQERLLEMLEARLFDKASGD